MNATGMELYLTTALISILPIGAILFSILTFHYTGVSFLHWIAAIVWFACAYFFMRQAMDYSILYYNIIAIVAGCLGLVMVFAPFFLSAKHQETLVDDGDATDRYLAKVDKVNQSIGKYRKLRPQKRITSEDGHPLV
jgi:hypothetical protein